MNPHRIKAILADEDFAAFLSNHRESLTKKVMHHATTLEDRESHWAEYQALDRIEKAMRSVAQAAEDNSDA